MALTTSTSDSRISLTAQLAQTISSWRYSGGNRDLRLDLLRGFAALAMIIDHVGGKDSWLYAISGGDRFFVSAAEGFVFISGLVMGIVYAGVLAKKGVAAMFFKGMRRVVTLYALTVALSITLAAIALQFALPWAPQTSDISFGRFAAGILTLHRAYYLTDVLLLYTFVIAASLPLFLLLRRGYSRWVLGGSIALWLAWQFWPGQIMLPWRITDGNVFHFASWQILFITGLVIGYNRKGLEHRFTSAFSAAARQRATIATLVISGAAIATSIALYFWIQAHPGQSFTASQLSEIFGKADLRIGRLTLFACVFLFGLTLSTLAWTPVKRLFGWLLLPLGQNALPAYAMHLFIITLWAIAIPAITGGSPSSAFENTLAQAAAILLILGLLHAKVPIREKAAKLLGKAEAVLPGKIKIPAPAAVRIIRTGVHAERSPRLAATLRIANSRAVRTSPVALAFLAIIIVSAGPAVARVLRDTSHNATPTASNTRVSVYGSVSSVPTGVAIGFQDIAPEPGLQMYQSGTAVPSSTFSTYNNSTGTDSTDSTNAPAAPTTTTSRTIRSDLPDYIEQKTFFSVSLGRSMPYYVYLPPDYDSHPDQRYPVLYMLHGMSGTYNEWLDYGLLGRANDMMLVNQISQFIIVLPQGDYSYWVDHADGGPQWGKYMAQDVVNEIDSHYRTLADRQHRALGGLSMGGYGALGLAILYPYTFGTAGAHSPALFTYDRAPQYYGDADYFNRHDPVYLYNEYPAIARTLNIWVDDGKDDGWLPAVQAFHEVLYNANIPHEWNVFAGGHEGTYWSTNIPNYLIFYSKAISSRTETTPSPDSPASPSHGVPNNVGMLVL